MQISYKWLLAAFAIVLVVMTLAVGVAVAQSPMTITLNEQNASGESGTAVLTDLGNGMTRVEVNVTGEPAGASQPMHIHNGTCANLDPAPTYPLNNLENGTSTTEITATLDILMGGPFALNGHKSAAEPQVYVFCGDLAATAAQATATTAATEAATEAATAAATEAATTAATEAATAAATEAATAAATEAATTAATAEATAAPTEAATAAAAAATATPAPTLPSTGASSPFNALIPVVIVGALILGLGLYMRRVAR